MQIIPRTLWNEVSGENAASFFPYLADRLDAIKEIKYTDRDVFYLNNHARRAKREGTLGLRLGSLPMHVVEEIGVAMGNKYWWMDRNLLYRILRDSSMRGWSFLKEN